MPAGMTSKWSRSQVGARDAITPLHHRQTDPLPDNLHKMSRARESAQKLAARRGFLCKAGEGLSRSGAVGLGGAAARREGDASVDRDNLAGHPARLVAGQEHGRPRDIPGGALVLDEPRALPHGPSLRAHMGGRHRRPDHAWADAVDPDVLLAEVA